MCYAAIRCAPPRCNGYGRQISHPGPAGRGTQSLSAGTPTSHSDSGTAPARGKSQRLKIHEWLFSPRTSVPWSCQKYRPTPPAGTTRWLLCLENRSVRNCRLQELIMSVTRSGVGGMAFRTSKTVQLEMRPIYVRLASRTVVMPWW